VAVAVGSTRSTRSRCICAFRPQTEINVAAVSQLRAKSSASHTVRRRGMKTTPQRSLGKASALTQTEDTGIGASFSKIALAEVVHVKGRQSLLWALM
jgi:hypothetical protein